MRQGTAMRECGVSPPLLYIKWGTDRRLSTCEAIHPTKICPAAPKHDMRESIIASRKARRGARGWQG